MKDENDSSTVDLESGPATDQQPSAPAEAAKEKKPRKPSKKLQQLIAAAEAEARERGFTEGLNHPDSRTRESSGVLVWMLVAFIAGMFAAKWVFLAH